MTLDELSEQIDRTRFKVLQPSISIMELTTSTNDIAKELARRGTQEGLVVVAKTQTRGRGRYNRQWLSPEGGLYASFILEPRLEIETAPLLGLLTGCAVVRALGEITGLNVGFKWPNDVMLSGRKVAGVLSELVATEEDEFKVVCGVGINLNTDPSPELMHASQKATAVVTETGVESDVGAVLQSVLCHLDELLYEVEKNRSYSAVVAESRRIMTTIGQMVKIETREGEVRGEARSLEDDGSLIVIDSSGNHHRIRVGDVTHLRLTMDPQSRASLKGQDSFHLG